MLRFFPALAAGIAALCLPAALCGAPRPTKPTSPLRSKQFPDSPDKNAPRAYRLQAGPISVKFQDGELRYLCVGDKEIVRRVYFGVRDGDWNTAMPKFTHIEVRNKGNSFSVALEAECKYNDVDYRWKGEIVGKADGSIRFRAKGEPAGDFKSNRIGICLLYGVQSLAGQKFATRDAAGATKAGAFPHLVSPTLVAEKFQSLRYATASGMTVTATITGARFDMEDQRNWGDTSYKAYAPLPYSYPNMKAGDAKEEELLLTTHGARGGAPEAETPVKVTLGKLLPNARIPKLSAAPPGLPEHPFADVNMKRPKTKPISTLTWGLNPSVHLPDADMLVENLPAIVDQAATARSFAPSARIQIVPVRIRGLFADGGRDPRNESRFGGAWSAAFIKYLSLARVAEAEFDMGDGAARTSWEMLSRFSGHRLYETTIRESGRLRVEALAVESDPTPVLFLINMTGRAQKVVCDNLPRGGRLDAELKPYEVREVRLRK